MTDFQTDTLAKTFRLQNRALVFDKDTILSKVHCHQKSILNQKTTQFKMSHITCSKRDLLRKTKKCHLTQKLHDSTIIRFSFTLFTPFT